ncbi:MAG: hypothetical protein AB7F74_16150 [Parvibaculaceae bacterium]
MKTFPSVVLALLAFMLAAALPNSPADAAKKKQETPAYDQPMRVVIVRSVMAGCASLCPQWISAEGQITAKSPAVFKKALAKAKDLRLPVVVTSTGGEVDAALKIGEMIREHHLDVAVGWTYFGGCAPYQTNCKLPKEQKGVYRGIVMSGQGFCVSACAFILAAGEKRFMGQGTAVGVHQISRTITQEKVRYYERYRIVGGKKQVLSRKIVSRKPMKSYVSTKLDRRLEKKLNAFFAKMGVDKSLLALFNKAPPTAMYILTATEAQNTRLVTDLTSAVDLVVSSRCKTDPPADNCVLVEDQHAAATP